MATSIVVSDLDNVSVSVDGVVVGSGSFTDILTNQKNIVGIRGDLRQAIKAWYAAQAQAAANAQAANLAGQLALKDARIAELQADKDRLQAKVADQQTLIDALGGTPLAREMRRQARRQAALDAQAAAEAELAAIDAEAP